MTGCFRQLITLQCMLKMHPEADNKKKTRMLYINSPSRILCKKKKERNGKNVCHHLSKKPLIAL